MPQNELAVLPRMMTVNEAWNACCENKVGVSKRLIKTLCFEGKIASIKSGRKTLLNWHGLVGYLQNPEPEVKPAQIQYGTIRRIRE